MANYFSTYIQDLEADPFDPADFVERLAWRMSQGEQTVDPNILHELFEQEISNLQVLSDQYQSKINLVQNQCAEEEEEFTLTLERLQEENNQTVDKLKGLDETIRVVATKVVHLGHQLEVVNLPRTKASQSLALIQHFNEFMADQPLESAVFTDPDQLLESAEIIHKLHSITQELSGDKYNNVKHRVEYKYNEIEKLLLEEFVRSHRLGNKLKMKQTAHVLYHFKGYSQAVDAFVGSVQIGAFRGQDVFADMLHLFEKVAPSIEEILPQAEQAMCKLVLNVFHGHLQEHISKQIGDTADNEEWLSGLYDLYTSTSKLCEKLCSCANINLGGEKKEFLSTLVHSLFNKYLAAYMERERRHLKQYCSQMLDRYYEAKGHHRRQLQAGGIQDLKARVFTPESFGDETFICPDLSINFLTETKSALQRCAALSSEKRMPENAAQIFDNLLLYLGKQHVEYAIELALYTIPLSECKTQPSAHYFDVVRESVGICHLFEKQFNDVLLPLIKDKAEHESCTRRKVDFLLSLEAKVADGLDRQLNAICSYVRFVLASELKKRPDYYSSDGSTDSMQPLTQMISASEGARFVKQYITEQVGLMRGSLDGSNMTATLTELGIRLHRVLLEHIYQLQVSINGALLLLCDMREYVDCVRDWHIALVKQLFETLQSLCNLLAVAPANLPDMATADRLADLEQSVVVNFVQLRKDYKSEKLYNEFR